jgi:hypothetical protein
MPKTLDITGLTFNYLTALRFSHKNNSSHYWVFICKCGKERVINKTRVVTGYTKSCGCFAVEKAISDSTTHGLSKHPLYRRWNDIIKRCYNPKVKSYINYGERGVIVCDEWKNNFLSFYNWCINNGWKDGLQIDKDINGNGFIYSPQTCCFVTPKTNSNNRRNNKKIEYNGEIKTLIEWSEKFGINNGTLSGRLKRGWSLEKSFTNKKFNKYSK